MGLQINAEFKVYFLSKDEKKAEYLSTSKTCCARRLAINIVDKVWQASNVRSQDACQRLF